MNLICWLILVMVQLCLVVARQKSVVQSETSDTVLKQRYTSPQKCSFPSLPTTSYDIKNDEDPGADVFDINVFEYGTAKPVRMLNRSVPHTVTLSSSSPHLYSGFLIVALPTQIFSHYVSKRSEMDDGIFEWVLPGWGLRGLDHRLISCAPSAYSASTLDFEDNEHTKGIVSTELRILSPRNIDEFIYTPPSNQQIGNITFLAVVLAAPLEIKQSVMWWYGGVFSTNSQSNITLQSNKWYGRQRPIFKSLQLQGGKTRSSDDILTRSVSNETEYRTQQSPNSALSISNGSYWLTVLMLFTLLKYTAQ